MPRFQTTAEIAKHMRHKPGEIGTLEKWRKYWKVSQAKCGDEQKVEVPDEVRIGQINRTRRKALFQLLDAIAAYCTEARRSRPNAAKLEELQKSVYSRLKEFQKLCTLVPGRTLMLREWFVREWNGFVERSALDSFDDPIYMPIEMLFDRCYLPCLGDVEEERIETENWLHQISHHNEEQKKYDGWHIAYILREIESND